METQNTEAKNNTQNTEEVKNMETTTTQTQATEAAKTEAKKIPQKPEVIMAAKVKAIVNDHSIKTSEKIRRLYDLEVKGVEPLTAGVIAKALGIRPQHANNVLDAHCIKNGLTKRTAKRSGPSKKALFIDLYVQGLTNKEIAIQTQSNQNHVWQVLDEFKDTPEGKKATAQREANLKAKAKAAAK